MEINLEQFKKENESQSQAGNRIVSSWTAEKGSVALRVTVAYTDRGWFRKGLFRAFSSFDLTGYY